MDISLAADLGWAEQRFSSLVQKLESNRAAEEASRPSVANRRNHGAHLELAWAKQEIDPRPRAKD
jgi:hypothetical protein